ncbi:hypothetical protein EXN66_Car011034 [Channa argus]|uniref:Uncharacterized protein n=1 Tax=Channa argus TaxID=215402 RepID=A0A6G1PZD2_CHAAH|nr:hypothetical protein EXN66_Car011034 [Channa argus]
MFGSEICHLQKFSDDSAIVGLITDDDDREYRADPGLCGLMPVEQINAGKTKELAVDFHRHTLCSPSPVNIQGKDIERGQISGFSPERQIGLD